jgi:ABC-type nitrate/sulfonate/bicarbonate transport system permease component
MNALPTRQLFKLHRYSGLVTAPLILFFAISGLWQVFRLQEDGKNGYKAPTALKTASDFHKVEKLGEGKAAIAFRTTISAVAAVLAFGASLGIILGFRTTRPRWLAGLLLTLGIAVPFVLYLLAKGSL